MAKKWGHGGSYGGVFGLNVPLAVLNDSWRFELFAHTGKIPHVETKALLGKYAKIGLDPLYP